ncbi:MAG: nitroreductase family deazaflavin-dependent oxidoreductase [Thermoproteota archaeon]|nr:nitroreductase family deazaflavin-dependent oxidoreductase [Thermoproteota archaeon]
MPSPSPQSQFLYLTTKGWKSGKVHKIEIWFVEQDGKHYVLSECKKKAHWVQNILHDSRISFQVNDETFNGHGRIIEGPSEKDLMLRISAMMDRKYGWSTGLIVELSTS